MGTLKRIPVAGFQAATPKLHVFTRRVFRPRVFGMNSHYWQAHPIEITWQCTEYFVDKPRVMNAILRAKKSVQMKAGAYIRRTARRLMPYRKRITSPPGRPPYAKKREPNLRTIFFAWDRITDNVVVGPVLFRRAKDGGGITPRLHEKGGTKYFRRSGYRYAGQRVGPTRVAVRYPKRPFMVTALRQEAPKFPGLWENSVRP